jgi:EAL domain-containing protein (putative c-di-GMP-specific phosphodiesterase class I)
MAAKKVPRGIPAGFGDRAAGRLVGASVDSSTPVAVGVIGCVMAFSWMVSYVAGGSSVVPPHFFYIAVILAAVRFGPKGVLVVGVLSGLIAGLLVPAHVSTGEGQALSDWLTRMGFFVTIGLVLAFILRRPSLAWGTWLQMLRIDRDLHSAIACGELRPHYQPIFDICGNRQRIVGVEALARWHHPTRGMITPGNFVPAAETSGRVNEIDDVVLQHACEDGAKWARVMGEDTFAVSVNVSATGLSDPDLVGRFVRRMAEAGIEPSRVVVEVTESAAMADIDHSITQLAALKELGVRIAVDDFGTGYSSLAYIHRLPIDTIKIDQSFTARIIDEPEAGRLVASVILLAHSLGMDALAEGVETAEQLQALKEMRCDFAQGFYLSQVLPADEITTLLEVQASTRPDRHGHATQPTNARSVVTQSP